MPHRALKSLQDMLEEATFIREVTEGETFSSYSHDPLKRRAVERSFEIIGEAMRRLRDSDPTLAQAFRDSARIIGFRNVLIHGYDSINNAVVWAAAREQLPLLIPEIIAMQRRLDPEGQDV